MPGHVTTGHGTFRASDEPETGDAAPAWSMLKWPRRLVISLLVAPIRFYQIAISPMLPPACRFTPTCSQYAVEAIRRHGPLRGTYRAARRILKCHPWHPGGYDPP